MHINNFRFRINHYLVNGSEELPQDRGPCVEGVRVALAAGRRDLTVVTLGASSATGAVEGTSFCMQAIEDLKGYISSTSIFVCRQ